LKNMIYDSGKPVARISHMAPHLDRVRATTIDFNRETDARPIISTNMYNEMFGPAKGTEQDNEKKHYWGLLKDMSQKLNCKVEDIQDFDLCFVDIAPGRLVGFNSEFAACARMDNQYSTFTSIESLLEYTSKPELLENSEDINLIVGFDHEEVGSGTIYGADSNFLPSVCERIYTILAQPFPETKLDSMAACFRRSFLLSADMAHSVHPNYEDFHQKNHQPMIDQGVTLKVNCNGRYTSSAITTTISKEIARNAEGKCELQEFIIKQDIPCGSTIGPALSSRLGCHSVDIGIAQLGMHSVRELLGTMDALYYKRFFDSFFKNRIPQCN